MRCSKVPVLIHLMLIAECFAFLSVIEHWKKVDLIDNDLASEFVGDVLAEVDTTASGESTTSRAESTRHR